MTLSDYLSEPGRSATALALACNVAVSTITRAARGSVPDKPLMQALFRATGGAVTPNDFFDIRSDDESTVAVEVTA